jgi:regulator of protease activity HflC (stomatin/prohibitin superfamily)
MIMSKIFEMKKLGWFIGLLFVGSVLFSSCRTQKQACGAYSSVEQVKKADSNS